MQFFSNFLCVLFFFPSGSLVVKAHAIETPTPA